MYIIISYDILLYSVSYAAFQNVLSKYIFVNHVKMLAQTRIKYIYYSG